ncbi:hypothetical protein BU14_0297s0004, partial [Porphyra umbilicalis]
VTLLAVGGDAAGAFSRSVALREAARLVPVTGRMLFSDVDVPPSATAVANCRRNAVLGRQVYFPVFYSLWAGRTGLGVGSGAWRLYSYGLACLHRWDFEEVGGWAGAERNFRGWGKEDVALYWAFKTSDTYSVFRALEPGLRHTWHERTCERRSPHYRDCRRSRYENYGSGAYLGRVLEDAGMDLEHVFKHRAAPL